MDKDIEILWAALDRAVDNRNLAIAVELINDLKTIYENFEKEILE